MVKYTGMKEQACPNCGAASPKIINEGEYKCSFCDTLYYDKNLVERRKSTEKKVAHQKAQEAKYNAHAEQAKTVNKMSRRVLLVVVIGLIIIFAYVGYMAKKSMDQSQQYQEEMIKNMQQNNSQ